MPRVDDFGDVLKEGDTFEHADLFDGKELFLQRVDPARTFEFVPATAKLLNKDVYHTLFREWDPDTWELGPIMEVALDKQCYSNKLAQFLSDKVFTHIPAESLQAVKLNFVAGFKRGDLPLKRWTVMKT